jgi:hypothetical protein
MTATTSDAAQSFANVLAAFRGARFALDADGSAALWQIMNAAACDIDITPTRLVTRERPGTELEFPIESAAGVVSFVLERAGAVGPRSIRTWIAPVTIPAIADVPAWPCPSRYVLVEAWVSRIAMRVRTRETDLDEELPTLPQRPSNRRII